MIDKWIYEEKLLHNGTTYSWTPKALEDLDFSKSIGELIAPKSSVIESLTTKHVNPTAKKDIAISPTWLA